MPWPAVPSLSNCQSHLYCSRLPPPLYWLNEQTNNIVVPATTPRLTRVQTTSEKMELSSSGCSSSSFHSPLAKSKIFRMPIRRHCLLPCNHSLLSYNPIVLLTEMLPASSTYIPQSNFLKACLRKERLEPLALCYTLINWGASITAQHWEGGVCSPGSYGHY